MTLTSVAIAFVAQNDSAKTALMIEAGGLYQSTIMLKLYIGVTMNASFNAVMYGFPADGGSIVPPAPPEQITLAPKTYYEIGQHRDGEVRAHSVEGSKWNQHPKPVQFMVEYDGPLSVTFVEIHVFAVRAVW